MLPVLLHQAEKGGGKFRAPLQTIYRPYKGSFSEAALRYSQKRKTRWGLCWERPWGVFGR